MLKLGPALRQVKQQIEIYRLIIAYRSDLMINDPMNWRVADAPRIQARRYIGNFHDCLIRTSQNRTALVARAELLQDSRVAGICWLVYLFLEITEEDLSVEIDMLSTI